MKKILVELSTEQSLSDIIADLNNRIPDSTKQSVDFQPLYEHTIDAIKDFDSRAQKIMRIGTSIRLEKKVQFSGCVVHILLDTSKKKSFGDKLKRLFK